MSMKIREICGDYALDIEYNGNKVFSLFFNSYRNALTVKRILEVDVSVPNVATVADFVEVVRCKDCGMSRKTEDERYLFCMQFADTVGSRAFCSYGKKKEGAENDTTGSN